MNILHKNKTNNDPDRKLFFVVFIGQASKQFDYNIVTFFFNFQKTMSSSLKNKFLLSQIK